MLQTMQSQGNVPHQPPPELSSGVLPLRSSPAPAPPCPWQLEPPAPCAAAAAAGETALAEEARGGRLAEARCQPRQATTPGNCPAPLAAQPPAPPAALLLACRPARRRRRTAGARQSPVAGFSALHAHLRSAARWRTPSREPNFRLLPAVQLSRARGIPPPRPTAQARWGRAMRDAYRQPRSGSHSHVPVPRLGMYGAFVGVSTRQPGDRMAAGEAPALQVGE